MTEVVTRACTEYPEMPEDSPENSEAADDDLHIVVGETIAAVEKKLILATLKKFDGDKPRAAAVLGISLKTLYNRLHDYAQE